MSVAALPMGADTADLSPLEGSGSPGDAGEERNTSVRVVSRSPGETLEIARQLGALLGAGDVVALVGELGSGKTLFTRGLCLGLGLTDAAIVSSPTYVLEHVYEATVPVHHYDVYRLSTVEEFVDLGFEERLDARRVVVIEWADRVESVLPADCLRVELAALADRSGAATGPGSCEPPSDRRLVLSGTPARWSDRLRRLVP